MFKKKDEDGPTLWTQVNVMYIYIFIHMHAISSPIKKRNERENNLRSFSLLSCNNNTYKIIYNNNTPQNSHTFVHPCMKSLFLFHLT